MNSLPVRGVKCKFKTAYDVTVAPIALVQARFDPIIDAPASVRLADGVVSALHIVIESTASTADLNRPPLAQLRLFVDGEPSFRAALLDTLFMHTAQAYVECGDGGRWTALEKVPLAPAGYAEDDALIPFSPRSHPAFRLLTEYFSFPEKFNFVDLDLKALAAVLPPKCQRFTLHLAVKGLRSDSNTARLLAALSANKLLPGCTPVVNLFSKAGVPIKLTHNSSDYPVLADATQAFAYEVHTIESVQLIRQAEHGDLSTEFTPLYSSRHGGPPGKQGNYWLARRNDTVASASPGHELRISLVDTEFKPSSNATTTLTLELSCTNRDLPASLRYGLPDGDLTCDSVPDGLPIRFLRKPSAPYRFESGAGAHWRLISHLSLNYSGLTDAGLEEFQKMLSLYDLPRSAISQRQINGIAGLQHGSIRAWIPTIPFSTLMPGIRIRMRIDEQAFVGSGLFVFAQVMDRYFGLNSQLNCFTQLDIVSKKTGEELILCKPRTAESTRA
jgi:type VI secretion system protein ImpG